MSQYVMSYKVVNKISEVNAAYIAGLIDGDGSILLSKRHKSDNRQLVISISNNDRALLNEILGIVGAGKITGKRTNSKKHNQNFTYSISNRQALQLLKYIDPYLKTYKRKRAELVLETYIKVTPRNGKYSEKVRLQREEFIEKFFAFS
jgi:intein/homing endonuclease